MYSKSKKMDAIEEFEIEIDLEDRSRVYDYATSKEVRRESNEKWKQTQFAGLGGLDHIEQSDENMKVQVRIMDKAIADTKGFLQTEKKDDKSKDSGDSVFGSFYDGLPSKLSLPRRALPVYHPGEVVKGKVILKLKEPVQADKFSVSFLGRAKTNIRVYHRYGYYDHTNYENYVENEDVLWKKSDSKSSSDVSDTFTLVTPSAEPARSKQLGAGKHTFGFEFTIPLDAAQSCPNLRQDQASHCYVVYRLKAELDSGKLWGRGDVVLHKGIWVEKPYDIGKELDKLYPVNYEEALEPGVIFKSGKVTLRAALPSTAFVKYKRIPITIELDNQTTGEAKSISARIDMNGRLKRREDSYLYYKKISIKGKKVQAGPIAPGMSPEFKWEIPWEFTESCVDGYLMPVGTLEDCKLIEVRYSIVIEVKRVGLHRNLNMEIPITIGTVNSAAASGDLGGNENRLYPDISRSLVYHES